MVKKIRKAIIPAAGFGTRFLPATKSIPKEMFPIIDIPTIQFIVEEAVNSGITDILIVVSGYKNSIIDYFDYNYELEEKLKEKNKIKEYEQIRKIANMANIQFVRQKESIGLGDAILLGESFVGDEPFAILLGDDIVLNESSQTPALKQCIDAFNEVNSSILGVQKVEKEDVVKYGIVDPKDSSNKLVELKGVVEKPAVNDAPSQLAILGRYVLTPRIFEFLKGLERDKNNEIELTDAILKLSKKEKVFACNFVGNRFDIGSKIGYIKAILFLAMKNKEYRNEILEFISKMN